MDEELKQRLDRIEKSLQEIKDSMTFGNKITSNIIGNMVWEWLFFGTKGCGIHPPQE